MVTVVVIIKAEAARLVSHAPGFLHNMLAAKRSLGSDGAAMPSKRGRKVVLPRLCDLPDGADLFANKHNALKAREKGILRSRDASAKYEEVRMLASRFATGPRPAYRIEPAVCL